MLFRRRLLQTNVIHRSSKVWILPLAIQNLLLFWDRSWVQTVPWTLPKVWESTEPRNGRNQSAQFGYVQYGFWRTQQFVLQFCRRALWTGLLMAFLLIDHLLIFRYIKVLGISIYLLIYKQRCNGLMTNLSRIMA